MIGKDAGVLKRRGQSDEVIIVDLPNESMCAKMRTPRPDI